MLNDDDLNRYARQVIIPNFDEEGQERLLNTNCLIVGAGVDVLFSSGNDDTITNNGTIQLGSTSTTYSTFLFDGTTSGAGVYQYKLYLPQASGAWDLAGSPFPGQSGTQFMTLTTSTLASTGVSSV